MYLFTVIFFISLELEMAGRNQITEDFSKQMLCDYGTVCLRVRESNQFCAHTMSGYIRHEFKKRFVSQPMQMHILLFFIY